MSEYTGKEIVILEGLEAVRKRPGMYIGSTGSRGLHHLIWEILDNSIDEQLAGFCNEIHITMQKDGGICIEDNGRGVPVGMHTRDELLKLEEEQNNATGFKKDYYQFMKRLTGKRSIQSYQVKKKNEQN